MILPQLIQTIGAHTCARAKKKSCEASDKVRNISQKLVMQAKVG